MEPHHIQMYDYDWPEDQTVTAGGVTWRKGKLRGPEAAVALVTTCLETIPLGYGYPRTVENPEVVYLAMQFAFQEEPVASPVLVLPDERSAQKAEADLARLLEEWATRPSANNSPFERAGERR